VNLDGLRIGDAVVRTIWDAKTYKVVVSADIGMLLISTQIQGEASGKRSGPKLTPDHFQMVLSGGEQGAIMVNFANSTEAASNGAVRLRGVFDPLSALLAVSLQSASPPSHPCKTVLPIFTGRDRFNLNLRLKTEGSAAHIFCQATPSNPLANETKQNNVNWEIVFSKVTKPHFWLVDQVSIPTEKGIVTIDREQTSISGP
jgi:hypothetical protein